MSHSTNSNQTRPIVSETVPALPIDRTDLPSPDLEGKEQPTPDKDSQSDHAKKYELPPQQIPFKYRALAFAMIIFFATGSSYADGVLSPLKSTLRKELDITNAQYGAITSAANLINTILPIIGGISMDYWGATYAALISSVFILVGTVVASLSANTGNYGLMIGGQIIAGVGSTIIEATQNKLFAHWFHGSQLGFAFGLDIAWNRVTSIIARATAVPMSEINGWWGWALWIPTIVCALNLALVCLYWAYERNVPRKYRPVLGKEAYEKEGWAKKKFALRSILDLPMFFWIFCGSQVLQNGAVSVYTGNLADIQTQTRGTSKLAAGYNSSLQGVIPIVLTPLVGWFFDKYGWRMFFVSWTGALYIVVFALIGLTTVHPLAPILLSSFALSTNAITFLCALPVLVGNDMKIGTAMGIWKAFQNANSTIMDVSAGAIQDKSATNSYNGMIYFIIAIKAVEVVLGPVYDYLDGKWLGHSLRMPEAKRVAFRNQAIEEEWDIKGWKVDRRVTFGIIGQLSCMIVVAWVLYIVYSLGT